MLVATCEFAVAGDAARLSVAGRRRQASTPAPSSVLGANDTAAQLKAATIRRTRARMLLVHSGSPSNTGERPNSNRA